MTIISFWRPRWLRTFITILRLGCLLLTIIVILIQRWWPKTISLRALQNFGWVVITINGVPCVPMALTRSILPVRTLAIGRSLKSGLKQYHIHSAILFITGLIWSLRLLLVSQSCFRLRLLVKSLMSVTKSCSSQSSLLVA